ncbi:hypothetical protein [Streptomyces cahuitamycinicus]|uniref:Uncharacterized protein n=1 Tax=Streptomyces cahuitamycinicus TaxID=2070367 RepID=A0A2N8TTS6_9ACTN|nr:hypothetical protein [Streptomyces cahuitamycinicus]PNG22422.1 hypothetical protein C1J00_09460 [Streptomyces cahuitamycinicus]
MGWDGIPWFVEGTAASEETLRLVVEAAACGGEGIVGPADLLVTALDAPANAVQVAPGAMVAKRRASTGGGNQSYAARMSTIEQVDIEPTNADGPRSDLIIARVEDPYGGETWPAPEDPAVGPYVFTRVIPDVPPGTTSILDVDPDSTAITLARVDVPMQTSVITGGMVTDLRQMARPRTHTSRRYLPGAWSTPDDVGPITDVWEIFPLGATWTEKVPEWATHAAVHVLITGLLHPDATEARGQLRVSFGEQQGAGMPYGITQSGRIAVQAGHRFLLDPADRGQMRDIDVEGIGTVEVAGVLQADSSTVLSLEVTYSQEPVRA